MSWVRLRWVITLEPLTGSQHSFHFVQAILWMLPLPFRKALVMFSNSVGLHQFSRHLRTALV